MIEGMTVESVADTIDGDEAEYQNGFVEYLQQNYLPDEDVYKPKKKKAKKKGLEEFYDGDEEKVENEDSTDN